MAKNKSTVYLGYDDEEIIEKHRGLLNSTVNKIGGVADWPKDEIKVPQCPLCGLTRPLIVQLYAPLEYSQFHRTLYVFSCLNPVCSQNSKSWLCIRTQHLDTFNQEELYNAVSSQIGEGAKKKKKNVKKADAKMSWCSGSDDWGIEVDAEDVDREVKEFTRQNEENGNFTKTGYDYGSPIEADLEKCTISDDDEDEDDRNYMENVLVGEFGQLAVNSSRNEKDDPNANCAAGVTLEGEPNLTGNCVTSDSFAEIEGPESDVVLVETPKKPDRDLIALLKHTAGTTSMGPLTKLQDLSLKSYFMSVEIEARDQKNDYDNFSGALSSDHIRELYQEYKRRDDSEHSISDATKLDYNGSANETESYEKCVPAHGDMIFHQFISILHRNPGQILRYSRDTLPLLIRPMEEPIPKCSNCNGETICEVQILSTLIPKLRFQRNDERAPIEYGNVLVFTCLKSCWDTPDRMRLERVIVQMDN